jgi:signal transduction histidine kinase
MNPRASLRFRVTLVATLVVAVALAAVGIALEAVLRASQLDAIDASLDTRAGDIESLLEGDALPFSLDVGRDDIVQVIDANGNIVAASPNATDQLLFADLPDEETFTASIERLRSDDYRFHVETDRRSGSTIIVGTELDQVDAVGSDTRTAFLLALPLLTAFVGAVVWVVIGRALRPVEAMRSEAADIGGEELHRRVPSPETDDEIGHLATTMNEMLDRIEASSLAQARFVSDASHELRTPIAVIRHQLEIGLREDHPDVLRAVAADVAEENLRMQRLVDDLLLLARNDGSDNESHGTNPLVDLDDIVLELAQRSSAATTIDTSRVSAGQVRCNPDHLVQVVRNLLDNALRHAEGQVAVTVEDRGPSVVLHVDDDGAGVEPADRERIFDRFARTDDARTRHLGGTGLGLAIASDLIHRYRGTIVVGDSAALGGARFTVTLPNARN